MSAIAADKITHTHVGTPQERLDWLLRELREAPHGLPERYLRDRYAGRWKVSVNVPTGDFRALRGTPGVIREKRDSGAWFYVYRGVRA